MSTSTQTSGLGSRPVRAYLQIGFAGIGALVIVWSLFQFVTIYASMPRSESGFAEGLTIIVFGLYTLLGFEILTIGLLIPQRGGRGLHFTSRERKLLVYGAIAPIVGILSIPVGSTLLPPLSSAVTSILVIVEGIVLLSGPIATVVAIGSRVRSRRRK